MSTLRRILCAVGHGEGLIVIGANAEAGLAAHVGSITDRIVREAACPVLTLRTPGSRP